LAGLALVAVSEDDWHWLSGRDPAMTDVEDPFAHLHREDYAAPYELNRATAESMIFMGGRPVRSLNGDWRFTLDLFDEGLRQRLFADPPTDPAAWILPRDHDPDGATTVPVPSCWTALRPEWTYFEGGAWYGRDIEWEPMAPGERLFLRIGAANQSARVFLDGEFLASHRGGSTPFFVELTRHVSGRAGRLLVHVDNKRAPDRVPMHHFDWFNHGGLYREVELVRVPAVFIADFGVGLVPNADFSRIYIDLTLSDPVDGVARVAIPELGIDRPVPIVGGRGQIEIEARPVLWSPVSPMLYEVALVFDDDKVVDLVGFREIRREGKRILLNGDDLFLRGVCVHEDDRRLGKVSTETDVRRRFEHARALGANCLRLAHYPHHDHVARIADEVGMLLWAEIPVYWAIDFANPATYADAENQLSELIRRDRNRASVVIWGVGNENADTDARYSFMAALAVTAKKHDSTRLVAAACLINRRTFRIEDRLTDHLDIIGLNEYFGWYEPNLTGLEQLLANSDPDRPVVISEFGADARAGHRGGARELFTEDCQAEIFRQQLDIAVEFPWIRGLFPWLLYDFRSERRQTRFQGGFNRKGLIADDKATRKLAFDIVAARYARLARKPRD
jgi:beta-glucuronidase